VIFFRAVVQKSSSSSLTRPGDKQIARDFFLKFAAAFPFSGFSGQ